MGWYRAKDGRVVKLRPSTNLPEALDLSKKKFEEEEGYMESCNREGDHHAMKLQPYGVYNVGKISHFKSWYTAGDGSLKMRYHTSL